MKIPLPARAAPGDGSSRGVGRGDRRPTRPRSAVLLAALLLLLLTAAPAVALDELPRLIDRVTDEAGVLTPADLARARQAIDELESARAIRLFAAFVPTTGVEDADGFAAGTAERNSLGDRDALLLVVTDDRTVELWRSAALAEVDDGEVGLILAAVRPRLDERDPAGAVEVAAEQLSAAAAGLPIATPEPRAIATPRAAGSSPDPVTLLAAVLVVASLVLVGRALLERRDRSRAPADGPAEPPG